MLMLDVTDDRVWYSSDASFFSGRYVTLSIFLVYIYDFFFFFMEIPVDLIQWYWWSIFFNDYFDLWFCIVLYKSFGFLLIFHNSIEYNFHLWMRLMINLFYFVSHVCNLLWADANAFDFVYWDSSCYDCMHFYLRSVIFSL